MPKSARSRPTTSVGKGLKRPTTARPAIIATTSASSKKETSNKETLTAQEDLSGVNDPIAKSIQDRNKAGGLTAIIKEADAKKQGIIVKKLPLLKLKGTTITVDFLYQSSKKKEVVTKAPNAGGAKSANDPAKRTKSVQKTTSLEVKP